MEFVLGLNKMDFHSLSLTWLQLLQSARYATSRDEQWAPDMAPFLWVASQQPGGRLSILDHFLHWKVNIFFTGVDIYSGHGFAFPACNASTRPTFCGLVECCIYHHCIPQRFLLTKEFISQLMKCNRGPEVMESIGLTMFPTSWNNSSDRKIECPFEDTVPAPIR